MEQQGLNKEQGINVEAIIRRFQNINAARLKLTKDSLHHSQSHLINLLPLFFHENNPSLPGYIDKLTPAGIIDYSPQSSAINSASSLFKDYKPSRQARRIMEIDGLYFMGSSGSIAFNRKSDFDVWLLHAPDLAADRIDLIQQKAHAIETWAEKHFRLEVHFFIFSANEFKQGKQQGLSSESSGSAQHYLLLDEFYRSSLLIAGKIPAWWLVPTSEETNYDNYLQSLYDNKCISQKDTLDFGSVADIPASEFFGAAVWQLYKSISSPYKSLMKLLLIEVYASEYPDIELLSMTYKQCVHDGSDNIDDLDPYLIMYDKIENYLMMHHQTERLELFRQCFYLKINEPLSNEVRKKSWRRKLFQQIVLEWGWSREQLLLMDRQQQWQIAQITRQQKRLMNALTESYRFLSAFARKNADILHVNKTELNVLGRKLYAAFEKKTGKVDIINRNNANNLNLTTMSIQHHKNQDGVNVWQLYENNTFTDDRTSKPIKRTNNVVELLAWCYFNSLLDSHSAISLNNRNSLTTKEVRQLLATLEEIFPGRRLPVADFNDLNQPARIHQACLFINIGETVQAGKIDPSGHIASERDNIFSYSGMRANLAITFDLLLSSTWEELLTFHYSGTEAILNCLCEFMNWSPLDTVVPPRINVFTYSSSYDLCIVRQIEELFQDIVDYFFTSDNDHRRYLLEVEDCYYALYNEETRLNYQYIGNKKQLLRYLGRPNKRFTDVYFDRYLHHKGILHELYQLNQPERIQLFFLIEKSMAEVYVIDECGSLFIQSIPFYDSKALVKHFELFFNSTINRRTFLTLDANSNIDNVQVEFHNVSRTTKHRWEVIPIKPGKSDTYQHFFNLQVIGNPDDEHNSLTIFCEDSEFSLIEHGNRLFNVVADYVIQRRNNGEKYPIYITDVDISKGLMGQNETTALQTIHYLNYKKRIEDKLNSAIATS